MRPGTTILVLAACTLALGAVAHGAEAASSGAFAGLWEVIPTSTRMPGGAPRARDGSGRPLGSDADDQGLTAGDRRVRRLMTAAGRAQFDRFDPRLLPANNCESPGLPSIATTPNLQQWKVDGDTLEITHEYFSTVRTIHLGGAPPADPTPTAAGYATGRWDADTLVIETTALAPIWGGLSRNAPASDARVVIERYRVAADGQTMTGAVTLRDEKFLTRDLELQVRLRRPEPGTELVLFPCDPEAASRHLHD